MMPNENPAAVLMRLVNGFQVSQAIHVAAVLRIADHLTAGPLGHEALAVATGTHPNSLYLLLRALSAVGVFREEVDQSFALTPMADCLRSDAAQPVGPYATLVGRPYFRRAWDDLLHSVQTGGNAFRHVHGMDVWDYRAQHPEEGQVFDRAMGALSRGVGETVAAAYEFGRFRRIVDVGGSNGTLIAQILAAHAAARGVLFELPHVVAGAAKVLEASGVAGRGDVAAGSFFEVVPQDGDAYLLKAILHDWDDASATAILRVCRNAMATDGRVLVVERLIAPPNEEPDTKFSDLNMLVLPGGRERSRDDFAALFRSAGFRLARVVVTGTHMSILEAAPDERSER
jgi:O-methyltransferase domain/Dimerisation domain